MPPQQQIPRLLSRDDLRRFPGGSLSRQWSAGTVAAHNLALVWLPSRRTETGIRRTRKPEHALDLLLKLDKLTCGASFAAFGLYSALRLLLRYARLSSFSCVPSSLPTKARLACLPIAFHALLIQPVSL